MTRYDVFMKAGRNKDTSIEFDDSHWMSRLGEINYWSRDMTNLGCSITGASTFDPLLPCHFDLYLAKLEKIKAIRCTV